MRSLNTTLVASTISILTVSKAQAQWSAPWDQPPQAALSAGTGSVISAASWQICGGATVLGAGGVLSSSSLSVLDECNNANIKIDPDDVTAVVSVLDNSAVSVASWQTCGSTVGGGVGTMGSLLSPTTLVGDCNNSNVIIVDEPESNPSAAGSGDPSDPPACGDVDLSPAEFCQVVFDPDVSTWCDDDHLGLAAYAECADVSDVMAQTECEEAVLPSLQASCESDLSSQAALFCDTQYIPVNDLKACIYALL